MGEIDCSSSGGLSISPGPGSVDAEMFSKSATSSFARTGATAVGFEVAAIVCISSIFTSVDPAAVGGKGGIGGGDVLWEGPASKVCSAGSMGIVEVSILSRPMRPALVRDR